MSTSSGDSISMGLEFRLAQGMVAGREAQRIEPRTLPLFFMEKEEEREKDQEALAAHGGFCSGCIDGICHCVRLGGCSWEGVTAGAAEVSRLNRVAE